MENSFIKSIFARAIAGGVPVRRTPAEDVLEFLRFSSDAGNRVNELKRLSSRDWNRTLRWLDDSGLAFYFLRKLRDTNATEAVPTWVMSRLERNFAANQQRVRGMSRRFNFLNQKFNEVGVRYAVLKGFSLVPQFCPDPDLRHQSDFDYLVDDASLLAAQQVLLETGYKPKLPHSSRERIFTMPGVAAPARSLEQYRASAPHAVELHLDIWDMEQHRLPAMHKLFFAEKAGIHCWNGLSFPALGDGEAFLLQVLHACQHLFTLWIRTSCFFEIGYFLQRRASDVALWNRIEQLVGDNLVLRDFVVLISELAAMLFASPISPLVREWGARIRPGTRVWIENYARHWAFCELPAYDFSLFPRAKLVLFLLQQYRDVCEQKQVVQKRILPSSRLLQIASSIKGKPSLVLNAGWWKHHRLIRRSLFHALAGLRYVCEIPRWRWRNRTRTRSAFLSP